MISILQKSSVSLLWVLVVLSKPLFAQEERYLRPVSPVYALTNATVVVKPGSVIELATVVVKDGLINAVGKNAAIPPDAIIIKADSLTVYAGFIDGLSYVEVRHPSGTGDKERVEDPGNPPPEKAGITPQADVRDYLDPKESGITDLRAAGFTTAQVLPYGGMLPGTSAIIQLGCPLSEGPCLVNKSGFVTEFKGADHCYPSTMMGVMAKWKELYTQAVQARTYQTLYASNRVGLIRPPVDLMLESFYPVIEKRVPVVFKAEKILDVRRALDLQSEFGLMVILAEIVDGHDALNRIRDTATPVFLSLSLPEKSDLQKSTAADEVFTKEEWDALCGRRKEAITQREQQPVQFHNAGIRFGFSTVEVKPADIQKNICRIVAAGLKPDDALAALTTDAAAILGLSDRLGTVEPGKIANLVICKKSYFDEKGKVVDVFIDGKRYSAAPKENLLAAVKFTDLIGSWELMTDTPDGKMKNIIVFKAENEKYAGEISGGKIVEPVDLEDVELNGNHLKFSYTITYDDQALRVNVNVDLTKDTFKGSLKAGDFGTFPVEGKKKPE